MLEEDCGRPSFLERVSAMEKNRTMKQVTAFLTTTSATIPNQDEEIRRRAYEIYETRGREDGHDFDDWLLAEEEIKGTAVKAAAA